MLLHNPLVVCRSGVKEDHARPQAAQIARSRHDVYAMAVLRPAWPIVKALSLKTLEAMQRPRVARPQIVDECIFQRWQHWELPPVHKPEALPVHLRERSAVDEIEPVERGALCYPPFVVAGLQERYVRVYRAGRVHFVPARLQQQTRASREHEYG